MTRRQGLAVELQGQGLAPAPGQGLAVELPGPGLAPAPGPGLAPKLLGTPELLGLG